MKWALIVISLYFSSNIFSQSNFENEDELIEYISGVWNMDSLYGGWIGLHHIPSQYFADSAYVHFQFFESDVPETPLVFRSFFNGILQEETSVNLKYEEEVTFVGHWLLEFESNYFPLTLVINEYGGYLPFPSNDNITLSEYAFDANEYALSKCFPEFDIYGNPLLVQHIDEDEDGFGSDNNITISCERLEGYSYVSGDCNDTNPNINPDANEIPANDIDENCDGIDGTSNSQEQFIPDPIITPNPFSDYIHIQLNEESNFIIFIYDMHGNKLYSYNSPDRIDLSHLPASSYILKCQFTDHGHSFLKKLIKI